MSFQLVIISYFTLQLPEPIVQQIEDEPAKERKIAVSSNMQVSSLGTIKNRGIEGDSLQWKQEKMESIYVGAIKDYCSQFLTSYSN